jgi:hypothetical protein
MQNRFVDLNLPISSTAAIVQAPVVDITKNDSNRLIGVFIKSLLIILVVFSFVFLSIPSAFATPPLLKVSGNQIVTASGGCTVRLVGVDLDSLEWDVPPGDGPGGGDGVMTQLQEAVQYCNVNCVRVPLDQDWWDGNTPSRGATSQSGYQSFVDSLVTYCNTNNIYCDLDLHWSGEGSAGQANAQYSMPDENSLVFWASVAARYANNPSVLFDTFNEPYPTSWPVWLSGGTTGEGFTTPGFQTIVNTIRATTASGTSSLASGTKAENICIVGGQQYAYYFVGMSPVVDVAGGNGIVYSAHIYNNKSVNTAAGWESNIDPALSYGPVLVEEFGNNENTTDNGAFVNSVITFLNGTNDKNYTYGAMAWDMDISAGPPLFSDWSSTLSAPVSTGSTGWVLDSYEGQQVYGWLKGVTQPVCSSNTATPTSTSTNTPTNTPTNTVTKTPTSTPTNTVTNTSTNTPTKTVTSTPTNTLTNTTTNTITNTPTATLTHTYTNTPTNTPSNTPTSTLTNSPTNTATKTATNTATYTPTNTITNTPTNTLTPTITNTATNTATGTVPTNTPTNTLTNSPTNTSTSTVTNTPTYTATATETNTPTNTPTNMFTNTFTNTQTNTPTSTKTATPTNSPTNTSTNTVTNTLTNTLTSTLTNTPTVTSTNTKTNTPTMTATNTPTNTVTNTLTPQPTSTWTSTPTITPTYTATLSSVVVVSAPFPNPSNGSPITFNVQVPSESTVTLDVFTLAFRKIYSQTIQGDGLVTFQWDLRDVAGIQISNGLYYVRIHVDGLQSTTKILKVLILR